MSHKVYFPVLLGAILHCLWALVRYLFSCSLMLGPCLGVGCTEEQSVNWELGLPLAVSTWAHQLLSLSCKKGEREASSISWSRGCCKNILFFIADAIAGSTFFCFVFSRACWLCFFAVPDSKTKWVNWAGKLDGGGWGATTALFLEELSTQTPHVILHHHPGVVRESPCRVWDPSVPKGQFMWSAKWRGR